jgi:hypothetical protein
MKYTIEQLSKHVQDSLTNSDNKISKLVPGVLSLSGMTGEKTRHLYNNICSLEGANYLEVGTWMGSSFISALYQNNSLNPVCIENWSEFNGPKDTFINNVNNFIDTKWDFIEKDSFLVDENDIKKSYDSVDIYLYDGNHTRDSHKKAITHYYKFLSKYSIIMIDDWRNDPNNPETNPSWRGVIEGTHDGINESPIKIHEKFERFSRQEYDGSENYWNGVIIMICERLDI